MFTSNQIEEIQKKLKFIGVKDTQFPIAETVDEQDTVVLVQDGKNKRVSIKNLLKNLTSLEKTYDFLNLSKESNSPISLETAINKIPATNKRLGLVITFVDSSDGEWAIYQFIGTSLSSWTDAKLWKKIHYIQEIIDVEKQAATRIVLQEFNTKKFYKEFPKVSGAPNIGWAGALLIDDFSSKDYRDFYCCMTYGQGIIIRHTYETDTYEYLNSFIVDNSTTSSSYTYTNKLNSGGWGNYYNDSKLPLVYVSRCSPMYLHKYYAYEINTAVSPYKFNKVLEINYTGSKLANITSDITVDTEKKYLYIHGYKTGAINAIQGTSLVMVFKLPEPSENVSVVNLTDNDILWEFEFYVNEAAQDLCVSGGRLYYPYGSTKVCGLAIVDTVTGDILQDVDIAELSAKLINNPEPEGVAISRGNLYINYHHAGSNNNEVCLVEFPLQGVKESIYVKPSETTINNTPDLNVNATAVAYAATSPSANVEVNGQTLSFTFGLVQGEKGDKGDQGAQGPQGLQGPMGLKGEKGEKGDPGDVAVSSKTFFVFKETEEKQYPLKPVGGTWNSGDDVFTPPQGWSTENNFTKYVWMSQAIFTSDKTSPATEWTIPICITGEEGKPGADGNSREFIYKLTQSHQTVPSLNVSDSANSDDYVPNGWTDSPTGISITYKAEWVSFRTKINNVWGNWSTPTLWSKWGENGQDGDGVEYIFYRNNGSSVANPTPEDITSDAYQTSDFVPSGWSDNPQGVSANYMYEWVSQRKYQNGSWKEFSDPAIWAKYGSNGTNGLGIRTMFAATAIGVTPAVVTDNINPGSIWGTAVPNYNPETQYLWCIQAYVTYDNKLATIQEGAPIYGWQGPWIVSGIPGKDGTSPNYKTYVYKKSDTKPAPPTTNDPNNLDNDWKDYPDDTGQWWQCVGLINGTTGLVIEWSTIVLPVNGRDGIAQDGKYTEFRFCAISNKYNVTQVIANTSFDSSVRIPSINFTTSIPEFNGSTQNLWMTFATINPDDTLYTNWSTPVKINGEQGPIGNTGPAGEQGPQGETGIPGASFRLKYCLGTEHEPLGTKITEGLITEKGSSDERDIFNKWQDTLPTTTTLFPYIWCAQGITESNGSGTEYTQWHESFRLSGINGIKGDAGGKGQLVYPAGVYSNTKEYTTDANKAPYVLDTSDGNYYVLNAQMTWIGTNQNNRTPSQDYAVNKGAYWLKFDAFEAIYTKIGIIAHGLIGSAVFYNEYMFSQQGINPSSSNSIVFNYEDFDPSNIYEGTFTPNILFNFKTGEGHFAAGKLKFTSDGSIILNSAIADSSTITNATITNANIQDATITNAALDNVVVNGYLQKNILFKSSQFLSIKENDSKDYIFEYPASNVNNGMPYELYNVNFSHTYLRQNRVNKLIEINLYNSMEEAITIKTSNTTSGLNKVNLPIVFPSIIRDNGTNAGAAKYIKLYPGCRAELIVKCDDTGNAVACYFKNGTEFQTDYISIESEGDGATFEMTNPNAFVSKIKSKNNLSEPIASMYVIPSQDSTTCKFYGNNVFEFFGTGVYVSRLTNRSYSIYVAYPRPQSNIVADLYVPGGVGNVTLNYNTNSSGIKYLETIDIQTSSSLGEPPFLLKIYKLTENN